ncbi:MAG TPA: CoA transferase [Solirubrobacteraceae bacterium]|nr:CoA transferase [Solirubrobacteraceae bacterium]
MPELAPLTFEPGSAPLEDVAVLEVAGEFSGYAGRLLASLGANVTPVAAPATAEQAARLFEQLAEFDVLLVSGGADAPPVVRLEPTAVRDAYPRLIHAILTPFGLSGPMANWHSTDLVRLAAGGLLWLGGYPDAEPIAPYGEQSTLCTAIFAAIAVLLALLERDHTGAGRTVEISAQEVLVQALETSLPEYELTGNVRRRAGSAPREAATGVYPCADGFVSMVAGRLGTARAWMRLREWLVEEGTAGAEDLFGEQWETLEFRQRPESVARFSRMFAEFAADKTKGALYAEAQRRGIALAPVNTATEVLEDPQLAARGFFAETPPSGDNGAGPAPTPSAPYRFWTVRERMPAS